MRRNRIAPAHSGKQRCRGGRIVVNPDHDDFPALLAEALDVLRGLRGRSQAGRSGARLFSVAVDQVAQGFTPGLGSVNERRGQAGRHPLR